MIDKELLKQVREIEIRTKGLVNQVFSGEYHSVFKGKGMEFSEVREYQFGDDIRNIDWNVTARFGHPFVKIFEEERELTVILMIDLSGSLSFGTRQKTKQKVAAEISAILSFSALKNNDKVGLILFTDKIEKFVPPRKGRKHVLRIVREILSFKPEGNKTNLHNAMEFLNHTIKKRSIVFFISDFIDEGYEKMLSVVSRKHDFIALSIEDLRENELVNIGLVKFFDAETGEEFLVDTSSKKFLDFYRKKKAELNNKRNYLFRLNKIDTILIRNGEDYIKPLVQFFKIREKRW
ncbi:MAG: DUF58 domain-containing protein [Ignavibacterium sp.]|nr:DUF58 domain-containing protein [Ignavibacterium sp.]MCX7610212.1 DUF58 domain-containing protein [Ignavibacterium sp.]MDW8374219.1 DUF58 domain-containing protein [Ignavibacteriales bacterium]